MNVQEKTKAILLELKAAGYHKVTIGKPDKRNPACRSWMNGPCSFWCWHPSFEGFHSGYGKDKDVCRIGGWPAIWRIRDKYTTRGGCGNGHQSQYFPNKDPFVGGTYNLTKSECAIKAHVTRIWNKAERDAFEKRFFS